MELTNCSVKAIFSWQLMDTNELKNPGIIQLPGNPLHIAATSGQDGVPRLVVAMDPAQNPEARSLHAYTLAVTENRLSSDVELPTHGDDLSGPDMQVLERELRPLLYTVENLRKQQSSGAPEDAGAEDATEEATEEEQTPME